MTHWLKVELDEETGAITARHFCSAPYGPEGKQRDVTVHQDLELPEGVQTALSQAFKAVIDTHRPALEKQARFARAAAELEAEKRNEFDDPKPAEAGESKAEGAAE